MSSRNAACIILAVFVALHLTVLAVQATGSNNWVWITGSTNTDQNGFYGTQGVPDPNNTPGGRYDIGSWTTADGTFWIFGGQGYDSSGSSGCLNDLWQYNAFGAIALASNTLVFSAAYQGAHPPAQMSGMTNFGTRGFTYTNTITYGADASGWLTVAPAAGTLAAGNATVLTNQVAITGLGPGIYYATNQVTADADNSPQSVVVRLTVTKASQAALTFNPISPQAYNTTNALSASGGSGTGTVSYAVLSGPGQIVGAGLTNLRITSGGGLVQVCATKAEDANYLSIATTALVAAAQADQAIVFPAILDQNLTNQLMLSATASSGLAVTFGLSSGPATINANWATFSATGQVSIIALQAGNANWHSAPTVTNTFNVLGGAVSTLSAPTGVAASDGTYWDKVRVTWDSVASATSYLIYRNLTNNPASAAQVGATTAATYDDTAAANWPQTALYYWVKAANVQTSSAFSASDQGSCATDPTIKLPLSGDFDGDLKNDLALYQESSGIWSVKLSASGYAAASANLGGLGYQPIAEDFDGDLKTDLGVYDEKNGNWVIMLSGSGYNMARLWKFGGTNYVPVVGDFDGDRKSDPAVYQESTGTWLVKLSGSGYGTAVLREFGGVGYTALALDFDGDGKADPTIYAANPSTSLGQGGRWQIKLSGSKYATASIQSFGDRNDLPVPGMYNNDPRADAAIYNPANGNWTILLSASAYITTTLWSFGGAGYTSVVGDFDGDGKVDPAIYQASPSTWFVKLSGSGYDTVSARQ